jgi:hypothetical protein
MLEDRRRAVMSGVSCFWEEKDTVGTIFYSVGLKLVLV